MNDNILQALLDLRVAMMSAAGPDTAFNHDQYQQADTPLASHCGACAYVVSQKFGGEIMVGRVGTDTHYWNILPDGTQIDLTSDQYGGDGINPVAQGRRAPPRRTVNPRFKKFAKLVDQHYEG